MIKEKEMDQIFKVVVVSIIACVMAVSVKNKNPAGTLLVSVAAGAVVLIFVMQMLAPIKEFLDQLADTAGLSPAILAPLYKTLGIAIITKSASEACDDAKEGAFGTYIEIAGSVVALYVSLPLLSAVFNLIRSYLET